MTNRYSRQILFSEIGEVGQEKIRASKVVVIGCGALGTVSAEILGRAGVGQLKLIDRDFVEESNLQRQSLFSEEDAKKGLPKAVAAEKALRAINSDVELQGVIQDITWENIERLCRDGHIIVDGTDNFETRFLINDFCVKRGMPWIYGACVGSYGVAFAFQPKLTACLQCLFEQPPEIGTTETCDTAGILAPIVHIVAAYQVTQAIKILVGEAARAEILQVDVWTGTWRTIAARSARSEQCLCCGQHQFRFLEGEEKARLTRLCGRNAVQVSPQHSTQLDFQQLRKRLEKSAQVDFNEYMMRIQVDRYEIALFTDGRSIISGTDDFSEARAVYAKYIGS
ncbi:ThiF family adenylyltransferase [Acidobacteria bacterium AH-259-O06]|nr:ThiF family adenylyltransferase [Acidobacteria bacterium AH-259-O06]